MGICFIGGGTMAQSIIGGLLQSGWQADTITACDPNTRTREKIRDTFGIQTSSDNTKSIAAADTIIFAVKPQVLPDVAQALQGQVNHCLIVSIAAGITTTALQGWLQTKAPIVRTMPNTPALVQQGMTGIFSTQTLSDTQQQLIERIFNSIGKTLWVEDERQIDAITAISGSGPAYFFLFFEAVEAAAHSLGLAPEVAASLIQQTALGAATMAQHSALDSATLKQNVMSPGGTTEQAIHTLLAHNFPEAIHDALQQAYQRAIALSNPSAE